MDVKMFDEFVGEELSIVVQQKIRRIHGEDNPIKIIRDGSLTPSEPRSDRLLIFINVSNKIKSFSRG